jgi:multidrug efflux pump subunit AcrA (membrane-fusion protein)
MTILQTHFHQVSTSRQVAGIAVAGVLVAGGLGACGGAASNGKHAAAQLPAQSTPAAPSPVAFTVGGTSDGDVVLQANVTLRGTVSRGAHVRVNGRRATVTGRHWQRRMKLSLGANDVALHATKHGLGTFDRNITITRHHSAAEKAAIAQARIVARQQAAQAKAARQAQAEADFKGSATSISYGALLKDSSPFVGKHVSFRGQILQIQQDGSNGGIMLLSVTDQGYGLWTDNVWVDYNNSTSANENDVITVYGTITGTKSYDTQNGGNTYVPQMRGRYIDATG